MIFLIICERVLILKQQKEKHPSTSSLSFRDDDKKKEILNMYVDIKAYVCVSVLNAAGNKKSINLVTQTTTTKKERRWERVGARRPCGLTDVSRTTCEGLCRLASAEATGTRAPSLEGGQR